MDLIHGSQLLPFHHSVESAQQKRCCFGLGIGHRANLVVGEPYPPPEYYVADGRDYLDYLCANCFLLFGLFPHLVG